MATPPSSSISPDTSAVASAALVRALVLQDGNTDDRWEREHEQRQKFRRLVDPGIVRYNDKKTANEAIDCLLKLCDNILNHPGEEKYRRFKPTNTRIKALLVDPKGTLEYVQELGFRHTVENFQPYYAWTPNVKNADGLRIGAFVLREFQVHIVEKEEREKHAKEDKEAAAKAAAEKVKLAFKEDRKTKALADQFERERREARLTAMARAEQSKSTSPKASHISNEFKEE
ncbi:hypothetical protein FRC03_012504 [Tulasnella sp. 419]|nr:hypothetical protein FRC03_012504 [Tulasnella sp. 419]